MSLPFSKQLSRLPYLYRWLAVSATSAGLFYLILSVTMHSPWESLVLVPAAGWLVVKMLYLDPARLRSIGWSPKASLLTLLPPVAIFLQLLLFLLAPLQAGAPPAREKKPVEVRKITTRENEATEAWEHVTDEPDIFGVSAAKRDRPIWQWQVGVAVAEFVRQEPLEGRLDRAITTALGKVKGATAVAREDREVWVVQGKVSGDDLVRACAAALDQLEPEIRQHLSDLTD
jgi:hypothetical protein